MLSFLAWVSVLFIVLTPIWLVMNYSIEVFIDGFYDITEWIEEEYKKSRKKRV